VLAVGLALFSAILFGAMTTALRLAMRRLPDVELGAVVSTATAFAVAAVATAIDPPRGGEIRAGGLAVFLAAGLLAPGASQLFFLRGVRDAGAARTSVAVGAAPLFAVALALVALHEPVRAPLLVGAVLVVGGGFVLAGERERPERFRAIGVAFAVGAAILFSSRDVVVRWAAGGTRMPALPGAAVSLLAGLVLMTAAYALRGGRRRWPARRLAAFVPVGLLFGISYVALFEAYFHGRVTVVSPIVATESLWGVVVAAVVLRRSELIGRRLVAGAVLVVAGGAVIGAFR
jgi:drug/metabolite transporter (DMT)-like permease